MTKFTAREKADCAAREVKQRQWVYPRRVAEGKMTQALADAQIALMTEIASEYGAAAEAEESQGRLL